MNMKTLLEAMNKFAGEPEQKAGDQVRGTDVAKKSGKGKKHPFLNQLVGEMKATETERNLKKEFAMFKEGTNEAADNPEDLIKVNIPLMIRLLEYAREDAKSDMDLHDVAEQLIMLSKDGSALSMDHYDTIVGQTTEAIDPPSSQGAGPVAPGASTVAKTNPAQMTPADAAKAKQDEQNKIKSINQLKSAGIDINPQNAVKALSKADVGVALNPTDKETVSKMAPAIGDIMSNPQLAGQFKSLVQKAQQVQATQQKTQ
jgi:hypothetical protein